MLTSNSGPQLYLLSDECEVTEILLRVRPTVRLLRWLRMQRQGWHEKSGDVKFYNVDQWNEGALTTWYSRIQSSNFLGLVLAVGDRCDRPYRVDYIVGTVPT